MPHLSKKNCTTYSLEQGKTYVWWYALDWQNKEIDKLPRGRGVPTLIQAKHSGGRGRQSSMSSRPARSLEWVPYSQGYRVKPCQNQKQKTNKQIKNQTKTFIRIFIWGWLIASEVSPLSSRQEHGGIQAGKVQEELRVLHLHLKAASQWLASRHLEIEFESPWHMYSNQGNTS